MTKETANNGNGWICLHRSILDWQHWGEPNVTVVFLTLLLLANHKRKWWQGHRCERGETFATLDTLREYTKLSKPTIIRALRVLEDSGELVRTQVSQKCCKTRVCKYNDYQQFNFGSGKTILPQPLPQTLPQPLPKQQLNNDNNIIERYNNGRTCEQIWEDVKAMPITIEQFCKTENITPEEFNELGDAVLVDWALTGDKGDRKYLINAIRRKAQAKREQGQLVRGTLAERKQRFLGECKALVDKGCDRESVAEFARYYTQLERGGERMLFETYKGWNTETRYLINQQLKQKKQ